MSCQARRYGDQYICGRCGVQWDASDVKLDCKSAGDIAIKQMREALARANRRQPCKTS